jgi:hypothetical protein
MILMRRVGHAGHAVHLFRGGVEWLCVIVVLLLLRRGEFVSIGLVVPRRLVCLLTGRRKDPRPLRPP